MQAICHEMMLPSLSQNKIGTSELDPFRSSILGPWSPLSTLHGGPRGTPRITRGRGGWLNLPRGDFHLLFFASFPGAFRDGSIATETRCPRYVRFPAESDRTADMAACLKGANIGSEQSHSITVSARAICGLQGVPRRRFVGSGRQARHEEASLVALAVDFELVMLGGQVDGHREFWLALQDLCRVRCSRDHVAHLRKGSGEEGMMRVVRPCDPRKGLGGFGIFLGAIARAPEVAPETLWVVRVEAHRLLDPVDALLRRPSHVRSSPCCTTTRS